MPWDESDAPSTAKTAKQRRQWADIANSELERTGDDGRAKHIANGVIHRGNIKGGIHGRRDESTDDEE